MSVLGRVRGSRAGRIALGMIVLLLAAGLLMSVSMAGRALTDEERAAEQRAELLTNTVLLNSLTPEVVTDVISGAAFRALIVAVQGKILADSTIGPDAVAQVRIWRPDGTLIFSTAQRDKVGEFVARGNPQIEQALSGRTVSLLTDAQVAPKAGLQGSQERLYETFVPLHLQDQTSVLAVVQIDTRYAAIKGAADRVWRPVELVVLVALVLALILFGASLRRPRTRVLAPAGFAGGVPVADLAEANDRVRAAEQAATRAAENARKAEEAAKRYQDKLATSEQQLQEALAAARKLENEATKTRALEAEVQRLRDLAATSAGPSEAEVEAAAEVARLTAALKDSELERAKATQEVRRFLESIAALETEVAKVNAQLAESERARSTIEAEAKRASVAAKGTKDVKDKGAASELSKAQAELQETTSRLAEVQQLAQTSAEAHERVSVELEQVKASLADREKALAAREEAFAKGQADLAEREAQLAKLRDELAERDAAAPKVAELEAAAARVAELEKAAAAEVSELAPQAARVSELEARVRELEDLRRQEVADIQSTHERLANSQAELIAVTRRAKELEGQLKQALAGAVEPSSVVADHAAPVSGEPGAYEAPSFEPVATIAGRLSRLARGSEDASGEAETAAGSDTGEEEVASDAAHSEEAESLRSRLARAAAARHRPSSTPPGPTS